MNFEQMKNSIWTPVVVLLVLAAWFLTQSKISILEPAFDYLADKVKDKIEAKYSPFGPTPPSFDSTSSKDLP